MKKYLPFLALLFFSVLRAQNYVPDPTFGQNGTVVTNYNMYYDNNQAPKNVLFTDNKYVFAQKTQVSCFTENGLVDYTFGTMGYARIVIPDCPTCPVIIKDFKLINDHIFIYGQAQDATLNLFYGFIAKLNVDGDFDTTFGNNGIVKINIGGLYANYWHDGISDLVYKDGNYFAIGTVDYTDVSIARNAFVVKLNQNGVPDLAFGPSGLKKYTSVIGNRADNIFVYEDDLLIIGNTSPFDSNDEHSATFMKINEAGNLVSSFGNNGLKKIILVGGLCACGESFNNCVLIDNILYYERSRGSSGDAYTKIQKLDISTLQATNPVVSVAITDIAYLKSTDSNFYIEGNKVYILNCPMESSWVTCPNNFTLSRRFTDGTLDASFNQTGSFNFSFPGPFVGAQTGSRASAMVKTGDKILLGGYTSSPMYTTAPNTGFAMLRITDETLANADFDLKDRLSVYPNPTKDIFSINNPDGLIIDKITIADTTGKVVYSVGNSKDINIANLTTGIYFVKIHSQNKVGFFKIIKCE